MWALQISLNPTRYFHHNTGWDLFSLRSLCWSPLLGLSNWSPSCDPDNWSSIPETDSCLLVERTYFHELFSDVYGVHICTQQMSKNVKTNKVCFPEVAGLLTECCGSLWELHVLSRVPAMLAWTHPLQHPLLLRTVAHIWVEICRQEPGCSGRLSSWGRGRLPVCCCYSVAGCTIWSLSVGGSGFEGGRKKFR